MSKVIKPIARIYNDYTSKFAIPRQSGLAQNIISTIVFEDGFSCDDALRGIDDFSHLWLIWDFSHSKTDKWSPTVRPPRLGGNKRVGVFATRSPFRPNGLGLSAVRLLSVEKDKEKGMVLKVGGADLLNDTPIYDIKPYLPLTDIIAEAKGGFTENVTYPQLEVIFLDGLKERLPEDRLNNLIDILKQDPRPQYHDEDERVYGFSFADTEIKFKVAGDILTVVDINKNM